MRFAPKIRRSGMRLMFRVIVRPEKLYHPPLFVAGTSFADKRAEATSYDSKYS